MTIKVDPTARFCFVIEVHDDTSADYVKMKVLNTLPAWKMVKNEENDSVHSIWKSSSVSHLNRS